METFIAYEGNKIINDDIFKNDPLKLAKTFVMFKNEIDNLIM
jgi:hypothetical protein